MGSGELVTPVGAVLGALLLAPTCHWRQQPLSMHMAGEVLLAMAVETMILRGV